jgi:3-keto-L-gulonate-6-phosphate decarboxylase
MQRPWVQVAVDTLTVEEGIRLARLAVNAGADWIEVGTPLLTFEGVGAIRALVEVSEGRPVVADFKAQDGVEKYFLEAGRQGARVASVLGIVADASVVAAVEGGLKSGVEVVADLYAIDKKDIGRRARELSSLGVDYLMLHLGHDEAQADPSRRCVEGLEQVLSSVTIPVGVSTFGKEDATEAIRLGASFVVQGNPILGGSDAAERLGDLISAVKAAA